MRDCDNKHLMSDARCIRARGHRGPCWTAWRAVRPGVLGRTEFASPADSIPGDHRAYRERYIAGPADRPAPPPGAAP